MSDQSSSSMFQLASGLPLNVIAGQTLVAEKIAQPALGSAFSGLNLAFHVGDDAKRVHQNRLLLLKQLSQMGAQSLHWLNQTHSTKIHVVDQQISAELIEADGLISREAGQALMIMTADCVPIVLCSENGDEVACVHAGWRGLAAGIIQQAIAQMQSKAVYAWVGTCIGPEQFEVGLDVYQQFMAKSTDFAVAFKVKDATHYMADLYLMTSIVLQQMGVKHISLSHQCSFSDSNFYSYRRQAKTGRMASFVWIQQ